MDKLPQRSDLIYKEIEEFQDYELTNCIAYEMMIRNPGFLKDREYLKIELISLYHQDKITKDELWKFSDEKDYGVNFFDMAHTDNLDRGFFIPNTISTEILINGQNYLNIEKKENDLLETKVNFHLSRPKLRFNQTKRAVIKLNFALPKDELIAYISKVKDSFDKDNSIIKSTLELLGETLEKSDNKKTPKKPKASVYADWFYIYDYWKYKKTQGKTDKDIFVALEVENDVPYKEDMLRKIRDKMKYFIDDLGYKELITGVKNS
jgi:hypothetical protein